MTSVDVFAPFVFVVYVALLGASYGMQNSRTWYPTLKHPPLSPPPWLFGVVWPILYVLIAVSWARANYLVGNGFAGINYNVVNMLFIVNMVLNFLWSVVFFYAKQMLWGVLIIVAMIVTLGFLIYHLRADRACMLMLVPYMLWILFACYLNIGVYIVNK